MLVLLTAAGVGGAWTYQAAARDRDYRVLLGRGDAALRDEQTFAAIEAYSGAIALRPDSMLAHLRRGETYQRRGDLEAAARDFQTAAILDAMATRPLEELADVRYLAAALSSRRRDLRAGAATGRPRRARQLQAGAGALSRRPRRRRLDLARRRAAPRRPDDRRLLSRGAVFSRAAPAGRGAARARESGGAVAGAHRRARRAGGSVRLARPPRRSARTTPGARRAGSRSHRTSDRGRPGARAMGGRPAGKRLEARRPGRPRGVDTRRRARTDARPTADLQRPSGGSGSTSRRRATMPSR